MLKNVTIFSSNLNRIFGLENVEIWFSLYWKSCRELNFLYKTLILNQLEFWAKSQSQNMKQVQKITHVQQSSISFQNSNRDQHQICSSLFKQVYLLPQLQKKSNNLALKLSHPFPYNERRPLPFSEPHSLWRAREKVENKSCCATIILTLVVVQYFFTFSLAF